MPPLWSSAHVPNTPLAISDHLHFYARLYLLIDGSLMVLACCGFHGHADRPLTSRRTIIFTRFRVNLHTHTHAQARWYASDLFATVLICNFHRDKHSLCENIDRGHFSATHNMLACYRCHPCTLWSRWSHLRCKRWSSVCNAIFRVLFQHWQ